MRFLEVLLLLQFSLSVAFVSFTKNFVRVNRHAVLNMVNQVDINMPALSSTMKEGKIVSWNKKVGDKVSSGDVLLVVESDKADMDVEAYEEGYLAAIYTPEGGSAPVGAPVATLVEKAEDISKVAAPGSAPAASELAPASAPAAVPAGDAPEFEQILMPALSSTMKEGKIVSWSKKVGDKVSSGDMVLVVESDKADMDVESFEDGYLAAILVGDGESTAVGAPVGYLAKSAEEVAKVQAFVKSGGKPGAAVSPTTSAGSAPSATPASSTASQTATIVNDGRVSASGYAKSVAKAQGIDLSTVTPSRPDQYITSKDLTTGSVGSAEYVPAPGVINATPMARKVAAENNLDVTKLKGTGNFGRVTIDDVLKAAGKYVPPKTVAPAAAPTPSSSATPPKSKSDVVEVLDGVKPMDGMQKAVAKNMEATLSTPIFRVSR